MKKNVLLFLSFFLISLFAGAQQAVPPAYEILTDTADWNKIDEKYCLVLEDKEGSLSVEEVAGLLETGKFHPAGKGVDSTVQTYWFMYRVKNVMNRESHVSLNSMCEKDEFYIKQPGGGWQHFSSGYHQGWDKKDGLKKSDCIPQILQSGQEIFVFQRISNKKPGLPPDFQIAFVNTEKILLGYYVTTLDSSPVLFPPEMMMEVFNGGMLLIVFIFGLIFYRATRQKVYLYFALYVLLLSVTKFTNSFTVFMNWYDRDNISAAYYFAVLTPFMYYFLIQFIRLFFSVKTSSPGWDRVLWILGIAIIPLLLLRVYFYFHNATSFFILRKLFVMPGVNFFIIFFPLLLSLFGFMRKMDKSSQHKIILAGALPYFLWRVITSSVDLFDFIFFKWSSNDVSGSFSWTWFNIIETVSMLWFILTFSFVLFNQFIELKKQNAQQELDKQRLAFEKETERNELIAAQKIQLEKDVALRTAELKQSLEELKSTQSQLIQSEKMASLGELTAGIAHEIQNPLNFVNNFSEVSVELTKEMVDEVDKGNTEEVKVIAADLVQNLEKINHHGKRADAIVKGMLQHSRAGSGQKEPTDINALCDEYLRLSYHGLRAKDKSFNAKFETRFDNSIGKINVVPQDMGRVILNLINNAFYAVSEKPVHTVTTPAAYEPTVTVSTEKTNNTVVIKVTDNGNGIPENILDKIFQPFFTTKPTGQGTGLGLSMSYDIVTKGHGGELKVETLPAGEAGKESGGTSFIIILPIKP